MGVKKSRFPKAQTIGVSREQEAGGRTCEVCRGHKISPQIFFSTFGKRGAAVS